MCSSNFLHCFVNRRTHSKCKEQIEALRLENRSRYSSEESKVLFAGTQESAESKMYLLEIIQNAIDVGATTIGIRIDEEQETMEISHNGKPFRIFKCKGIGQNWPFNKGCRISWIYGY